MKKRFLIKIFSFAKLIFCSGEKLSDKFQPDFFKMCWLMLANDKHKDMFIFMKTRC